jgi:translation elongation factor EF-Tu-like GTPase
MVEKEIGTVIHYWDRIGVVGITLSGTMHVGDTIHIVGATTDFTTTVQSIQEEKRSLAEAGAGHSVGIKVPERARPGDTVYQVE